MSKTLGQTKIAKRYVTSLFSSVDKQSDVKAIAKDMSDLGAMLATSTDLQHFIKTPLLSVEQQMAGMESLAKKAKFSKFVKNFLMVLAEKRRLPALPAILREVESYLAKQAGTIPVVVATARQLSAAEQKKIGTDIKAVLGQDIVMQAYQDESLIGGMVVQVESTLIDGSLKTKLDKLERDLTGGKAA